MSTNYYFIDKQKQQEFKGIMDKLDFKGIENKMLLTQLFNDREDDFDSLFQDFKSDICNLIKMPETYIHICQNAMGWVTLFQSQPGKFTNYKELEQYYKGNIDNLTIEDEYGNEITWDELTTNFRLHGQARAEYVDAYGYSWDTGDFS